MILGIGVDIIDATRFTRWLDDPYLLGRYFRPEEIVAVQEKGAGARQSLAARFAAKEAFGKALGTGLQGFSLKDVEVASSRNGKPELFLHGPALSLVEGRAAPDDARVHLSLSHDGDLAVAMVVLEAVPKGRRE